MRGVVAVSSGSLRVGSHGAARTVSSVKGSSAPAATLVGAPAGFAGKGGVVEAVEGAGACAVDKGCVAEERDVVEAEVPDRSVDHAVGAKGHQGADNSASEDIVPGDGVSLCFAGSMNGSVLTSCGTRQW
jgi:hypothetical protein